MEAKAEMTGLEKLAIMTGMVWIAIWASVGYVMILWMRARVEYHFRIPIAHSHGLLFSTIFLITMFAIVRSRIPKRVEQGLIGVGLFTIIVYPLGQLGEIVGVSYVTDLAEILFVLYLLSMVYVVYKMKF